MSKVNNSNFSWRTRLKDIAENILSWCFALLMISSAVSFVIYKITDSHIFKQISFIALFPFFLLFSVLLIAFFGSFIIYCFLCLMPWRDKEPQIFIFGEEGDSLPWWGAAIWLVVIFVFLSQVVPTAIHNIGVGLGLISDDIISLGTTIDQTTLRGLFTAWVVGERTLLNSVVSWSLIIAGTAILTGLGWILKKLWRIKKELPKSS